MALFKSLKFDNIDSMDYGVYISGESVYDAPERDVEMIAVPGRNGEYAIDHGRFLNIDVSYPAGIGTKSREDFADAIRDFRNALMSRRGYKRLEDDYHPDEFRLGIYKSGLDASPAMYGRAGQFDLVFNCKPQRFLKAGETETLLTPGTDMTIYNPTMFEASPTIRLGSAYYGATITINGVDITVAATSVDYTVIIDTDLGEAYRANGASVNNLISIPGNEFPKLVPGNNTVKFTRGSSSSLAYARIIPNWWRI